jgi:hypothetical protein
MCCLLSSPASAIEDDDFWLMLDIDSTSSSISFNSSIDADGGFNFGSSASLSVTEDFYLNLSASQQDLSTDTSQWSWGIGNDPQNEFSWILGHEWSGKSGVLETRNNQLGLNYFSNGWNGILAYEKGELEIFIIGENRSRRFDHDALTIGLGYSGEIFYWQFEQTDHSYNVNLAALTIPRIAAFVKPEALSQSTGLAEKENNLRLGYVNDKHRFELSLYSVKSAVTRTVDEFINLSANKRLNSNLSISIDVGVPLEAGPKSIGAGIIYSW